MNKNKIIILVVIIFSFILSLTSCKKEDSSELKLYTVSYENNNECYITGIKSEESNLNLTIPSNIYKNNIEYKVVGINELAFAGLTNIETVIIPDSVTFIESQAFARCTSLKKIKLSNNLTTIDSYAFDGCTNLINIELPDSLINLGYGAFRRCLKLTSINIPFQISEIKNETFYGDSKLNYVRANKLTHIYSGAFGSCTNLKEVFINQDLTNTTIDDNNSYFSNSNINVSKEYKNNEALDNYYFVFDFSNKTCAFAGFKAFFYNKKISIPESVEFYGVSYIVNQIYDYAFYNENFENIELNEIIIKINSYAFSGSNIEKIDLNNVIQVETYAFYNCENLKKVTFTNATLTLGDYAFSNCISLKNVTLPINLKSINKGLFSGCSNLIVVTIYESVTSINSYAFLDCSNLTTINYTSTKENFDVINIDSTTSEEIKNISIIYEYPVTTSEE